jgi:addiction module HigA family antidote
MVRIPTHGPPTHPGEMLLEEFIKPLGLTQAALSTRLGVTFQTVNRIVNRKQAVTPDMALRLERAFGMEAQFWLNLQLAWDLYHTMHGKDAEKIKHIQRIDSNAATAAGA